MATYTPQIGVPIGDTSPYNLALFSPGYSRGEQVGVFEFAGSLFVLSVWLTPSSENGLVMSKSSDGGVTWTNLDTANGPTTTGGADGAIVVHGSVATANFKDSHAANITLLDFDLIAGTWGAPYAPFAVDMLASGGSIWLRSNNTFVLLYLDVTGSGLFAAVYDIGAGSWGSPIDVGVNITTLAGYPGGPIIDNEYSACMDASDNLYIFFSTVVQPAVPDWSFRVFFQLLSAANAVPDTAAGFNDFPGQGSDVPDDNDMRITRPTGLPSIIGGNIVFPICRNDVAIEEGYACCYLGVGIPSIGSWVESSIPVDPGHTLGSFPNTALAAPMSFFDGAGLYMVYRGVDDASTTDVEQVRLCQCVPAGNDPSTFSWTAQTVCLQTDAPFSGMASPFFYEPSIEVAGHTVMIDVTAFEGASPFNNARVFMGNAPGAATPGNVIGSFVGFTRPGHFGGGTK